jgi:hypothetical protein
MGHPADATAVVDDQEAVVHHNADTETGWAVLEQRDSVLLEFSGLGACLPERL